MNSTSVFSHSICTKTCPNGFLPEIAADLNLRAHLIHAGAEDAWVRRRVDPTGVERVWAYAVVTHPIRLPEGCTATLVPVNQLPRDSDGHVDAKVLAALDCPVDTNADRLIRHLHVQNLSWQGRTPAAPCKPSLPAPLSEKPAVLDGGPVPAVRQGVATLSDLLVQAAQLSEDHGITLLARRQAPTRLSYHTIHTRAQLAAAALTAAGLRAGDTVLCLYQDDEDEAALTAIWGSLYAGLRPVPLLASRGYAADDAQTRRLCDAADLLPGATLLATKAHKAAQSILPQRCILNLDTLPYARPQDPVSVDPESPAAFFLTSGSTAKPKIVPQTHNAILSLIAGCAQINELTHEDVSLNWLPMDHVGSFIMLHMRDTYLGARQLRAVGRDVLRDPLTWITWMSDYRVTNGWAPNFAFELVTKALREISGQIKDANWDLSHLRFLHNGGEAVIQKTAESFLRALAPFGISPRAVRPAWGMSETSSGSVFNPDYDPMSAQSGPIPVGRPTPGLRIRITDPADPMQILREGQTGLLQVAGPMVFKAYDRNPEKTRESFVEPGWFATGDMGRIEDGNLYITGREKDVIIVNGLNISPAEVETLISRIDGVLPSCTAVVPMGGNGETDKIAVFFVPEPHVKVPELLPVIRRRLSADLGLSADAIFALREADIPKTSIGKIQKEKLKANAEGGSLTAIWNKPQETVDSRPSLWDTHWQACPAVPAPGPLTATLCGPNAGCLAAELAALDVSINHVSTSSLMNIQADSAPHGTLVILPGTVRGPFQAVPLVQSLARLARRQPMCVIWFCPNSAMAADHCGAAESMVPALLRSAAAEYPSLSLRVIDPGDRPVCPKRLKEELADPANVPELRWTAEAREVMRHAPVTRHLRQGIILQSGARYLVTGGLGGIGQALCAKLQADLDASLVVVGRRTEEELSEDATKALTELRSKGVVEYVPCDLSGLDGLATLQGLSCDGIFHLAGLATSEALESLNPISMEQETRVKIHGTEALLAAARSMGAEWVVAFGSVIGTFGSAGYASYAMANRYLQARAGRPAECKLVTLNWSMWDGVGVSAGFADRNLVANKGFDLMSAERALSALRPALESGLDSVLIGLDPSRLALAPYLSSPVFSLADTSSVVSACENDPFIRALCKIWTETLSLTFQVSRSDNIFDLGATSLDLPRAQERITQIIGCEFDVLDLFDHPVIDAFGDHMRSLGLTGNSAAPSFITKADPPA